MNYLKRWVCILGRQAFQNRHEKVNNRIVYA